MINSWIWIIVLLVAILVIALIATLLILKKEENKLKQYEAEGDTVENELQRSHEYESQSLKRNIPSLLWVYGITIMVSIIVLAVYIYNLD
ncbi:hypothetical protein CWR48_10880 [Oceanobacillus arenosus]|uniref:Uncharacterized protein n=1 Tax=Oceanobacillus arenosus TaxID=1229153 RepID=A0A3D8PPS4_9BACI|nr:hypothetical protein [Oceanobacillus arenosus]RDW18093.1 hypothetical protein CWR48_10880 [Oceanobacillus arenosus]